MVPNPRPEWPKECNISFEIVQLDPCPSHSYQLFFPCPWHQHASCTSTIPCEQRKIRDLNYVDLHQFHWIYDELDGLLTIHRYDSARPLYLQMLITIEVASGLYKSDETINDVHLLLLLKLKSIRSCNQISLGTKRNLVQVQI